MIFTERQIIVRNGKSTINEPVILYRGDYEVSIKFTIIESKFRFKSGVNLVDSEKASHGQLAILTPYGDSVISEIVKCEDGTVTFTLSKEMIDQLEEVGLYSFQIRLFDYYRESRISIPPVEFGIEVREPVASEDHNNIVGEGIVGYATAKYPISKVSDGLNEDYDGPTFDDDGQYNKTDWEIGDRISQGKLNKIEDALDKINKNEKKDVADLDKRVTNNFNVLDTMKADRNEVFHMGNMGQDVKEAMTGGSVPVVGIDAVQEVNIVNESVSVHKTDLTNLTNLFDGVYHSDIYVEGAVYPAKGDTTRTACIPIEPYKEYTIYVTGNDRFAATTTRYPYGESDNPMTSIYRITPPIDPKVGVKITFKNLKERNYLYIYVSNSRVDCPLMVYENDVVLNDNIKIHGANILPNTISSEALDFTDAGELFDGFNANEYYVTAYDVRPSSDPSLTKTFVLELEPDTSYKVRAFNCNRFVIGLTYALCSGSKVPCSVVSSLDDYNADVNIPHELEVKNINHKYMYVYTNYESNHTPQLSVKKVTAKMNSNIKITNENIINGFIPTYNKFNADNEFFYEYFVNKTGSLDPAAGDTARTTYFSLEPNTDYQVTLPPECDRQRVCISNNLFTGTKVPGIPVQHEERVPNGEYVFKFNSGSYSYCHVYVSNVKYEPIISVAEKRLIVDGIKIAYKDDLDVSNSSNLGVNVKAYGATGNGVTNDTEAVLNALAAAKRSSGILYFPNGTYMMDRAIYMSSNMQIIGDRGATIKKFPAITQLITQNVAAGQNYVYVEDASKYYVGQDAEIGSDREGSARYATPLLITAIDLETNKIEFEAYYKTGATKAYNAGGFFTSSFSILRTNGTKEIVDNILIQGITLDGNRQADEPSEWGLSCIHIDPDNREHHKYKQSDIRIIDVEVLNSPADAISDQSSCDSYISGCTLINAKRHGVHWGTIFNNAVFDGNTVKDCGLDGVFWCENVSYVRCVNNYIENCKYGCDASAGGTTWGLDSIIANNVFNNMTSHAIYCPTWKGLVITGNVIKNVNGSAIYANNAQHINISNNVIKNYIANNKTAIYADGADFITVIGNVIDNPSGTKVNLPNCTNAVNLGNGE